MVYPRLLAAIGDVAHPSWRASSVGVYRLWRDLGYAIGALLAAITADALGLPAAMWLVAALTFASGVVVAVRMSEAARSLDCSVRADERGAVDRTSQCWGGGHHRRALARGVRGRPRRRRPEHPARLARSAGEGPSEGFDAHQLAPQGN